MWLGSSDTPPVLIMTCKTHKHKHLVYITPYMVVN